MDGEYNAFAKGDLIVEPTGDGVLRGLSFAVKDVVAVKGHTNGAGNPDWLRTHEPAAEHADAVKNLLESGGRITGMTHTDELMFSLNGENAHYGTPVNPKAPGCIPGGSSSGSASAVAAGLVDFALGTDTGGSVRIPSSYCGIYGIRPTHGLISAHGMIPLAKSFDTVGWMARSADLLLQVGRAILNTDASGSGGFSRLLFAREAWEIADEGCLQTLEPYIPMLADMMDSSWVQIAPEGLAEWVKVFRTIQGYEIWSAHGEWITEAKPSFGPGIAERFAWAGTLGRNEFEWQSEIRELIKASMIGLLGQDGLLVIPTAPCSAPMLGLAGEEIERTRARVMQLSCIAGLSGLPQVTVPFIGADGKPVGLSFIAGPGRDLNLLQWIADLAPALQQQNVTVSKLL